MPVDNAGTTYWAQFYVCDNCGTEIKDAWPHVKGQESDIHYCWPCGFKLGLLSEKEFLRFSPIDLSRLHAGVNPDNGEIEFWQGAAMPPWEMATRRQRNTPQYTRWRKDVFKRDNFTCQDCGQRGGELQAHHIKPFSKYLKLRHEVSNGVTLCKRCHNIRHGKKR